MQVNGRQLACPGRCQPDGAAPDLDFEMVNASLVLRQMENSGDQAEHAPFWTPAGTIRSPSAASRAQASGLAEMQAPEGTVISYATQPGNVAGDGNGADSPLHVGPCGRDPPARARRVPRLQPGWPVGEAADRRAATALAGILADLRELLLLQRTGDDHAGSRRRATRRCSGSRSPDGRNPGDFQAYLRRYPNGSFAELAQQRPWPRSRHPCRRRPRPRRRSETPGGRSRFDGNWDVTLVCERESRGCKGLHVPVREPTCRAGCCTASTPDRPALIAGAPGLDRAGRQRPAARQRHDRQPGLQHRPRQRDLSVFVPHAGALRRAARHRQTDRSTTVHGGFRQAVSPSTRASSWPTIQIPACPSSPRRQAVTPSC